MNDHYERDLEAEIHRLLKDLPELEPPASLANRVMGSLAEAARPRPWSTWPAALRWASLLLLALGFAALCAGGWRISHSQACALALERIGNWLSGARAVCDTANVLAGSAVLILKKLGTGFAAGCLLALAGAYATCIGLGTLYVRVARAASAPSHTGR